MSLTKKQLLSLLNIPLLELMQQAMAVKLAHRGSIFSLCTICNVKSGKCTEDCVFCAQSAKYHTYAPVYGLRDIEDVLKEAAKARENGATRFSLVASGRGPRESELHEYARYIDIIRREVRINVCASLGILDVKGLCQLKEAGLSRYHHNLESSRSFFQSVCSTHSYDERLETINAARAAGLEVCAGGIIGLGENMLSRLELICELSRLEVESVPLNILVPIPGTPLEGQKMLCIEDIIRAVAIMRIALPKSALRIAGGRDSVLKDFQGLAFMAGADAMLIGGYLTVRGRDVLVDIEMVKELTRLWGNVV